MKKTTKVPPREAIDAALNRLLCEVALGDGALDVANCSTNLVAMVVSLGPAALVPLIADVAVASDAAELERILTAFSEAWNRWTVHGDAGLVQQVALAEPVRQMRRAGALTIAEAEESCVVFGMPKEAIARGGVVHVATLLQMPNLIFECLDRLARAKAS